jgi:hypothetical protein
MIELKFPTILILAVALSFDCAVEQTKADSKTDSFELRIAESPRIELIKEVATAFELKFPDMELKTTYLAPNFLLSTLECESKMETQKLKMKVQGDFPNCEIKTCTN